MGRTHRKRKRKYVIKYENDDLIDLQKWMKLKKCTLQMRCFPGTGRGLRSKKKTVIGDELISLPLHFLITPKTVADLFSLIDTIKLSPHAILSMFLMYERHLSEESRYWPYIKLLPSKHSTLFFCVQHEIELLPPFMKTHILEKQNEVKHEFDKVLRYSLKSCSHCGLKLYEVFTFTLFSWAWFTVNTRSVYYEDKEYNGLALAPLLDMFNHSPDAETVMSIDHERKVYTLKSLKHYKKKKQVFIKYGPHSNWKLLIEYGFVMENNPHDYIQFTFDDVMKAAKEYKPECGAITDAKYKFIKKNNFDKNLTKSKEEFSWNINALLYVIVTEENHFPVIYAKCYSNEFDEKESGKIDSVKTILIKNKREEFTSYLNKMESIAEAGESFCSAKKLIQIYLTFLA